MPFNKIPKYQMHFNINIKTEKSGFAQHDLINFKTKKRIFFSNIYHDFLQHELHILSKLSRSSCGHGNASIPAGPG
jgi:hypothetical protein